MIIAQSINDHRKLTNGLEKNTCFELIAFSMIDVPILVAAPTELVAIPAINRGAAAPAVVNVKMPPAIVKLPPITLALVPTERPILHLYNCTR